MKQLYLLPLSLLLIFSACENADNGVPLDESALLALLDGDEAAGMDGFDSVQVKSIGEVWMKDNMVYMKTNQQILISMVICTIGQL